MECKPDPPKHSHYIYRYGVDIDPDDLSDSESSDETDSEDGAKPGPSFQPPDSGNVSPSTDKLSDTETQSDSGVDSLVDRKEEPAVANVEPEQSAESMEVDSATPQGRSLEARTKVGGEAGAAGGTCAREEDKEKTKPEPSGRQDGSGNQSVETGSKGEVRLWCETCGQSFCITYPHILFRGSKLFLGSKRST